MCMYIYRVYVTIKGRPFYYKVYCCVIGFRVFLELKCNERLLSGLSRFTPACLFEINLLIQIFSMRETIYAGM